MNVAQLGLVAAIFCMMGDVRSRFLEPNGPESQ